MGPAPAGPSLFQDQDIPLDLISMVIFQNQVWFMDIPLALLIGLPVVVWFATRLYFKRNNQVSAPATAKQRDESESAAKPTAESNPAPVPEASSNSPDKLEEITNLHNALYTNITHEFRTPLTVISGMADMIEDQPENTSQAVEMIKRNSANLLTLINQMLDLSKVDSGAMGKNMVFGDIIGYTSYIVESLRPFAEHQQINLECIHEQDKFEMDFDPQKFMQILSNLISNGIKFTPTDGTVEVWTKLLNQGDNEEFQVTVRDSGIGIGIEHVPHIFDRFYRIEDTALKTSKGTGIGLALTKHLVELLGGTIEVQSATGKGATFYVTLPVSRDAQVASIDVTLEEIHSASAAYVSQNKSDLPLSFAKTDNRALPLVLVVEDSEDVGTYIHACLQADYRVERAKDGEEGIDKAIEIVPDVVVTDVMMPKKDGYEVCSTLKNDERTSHIPIVMLTAKADHESRLEGLETGADAYLSKPFDKNELLLRLRKLLELRESLRKRYATGVIIETSGTGRVSKEDAFITKLNSVISENMDDADFGITHLSRAMALSRAQLHNKIKALTGRSTGLYMRYLRLLRATELLKNNPEMNISEIAYDVGFKDPAYFTRCFTEEYGKPPSEAR